MCRRAAYHGSEKHLRPASDTKQRFSLKARDLECTGGDSSVTDAPMKVSFTVHIHHAGDRPSECVADSLLSAWG